MHDDPRRNSSCFNVKPHSPTPLPTVDCQAPRIAGPSTLTISAAPPPPPPPPPFYHVPLLHTHTRSQPLPSSPPPPPPPHSSIVTFFYPHFPPERTRNIAMPPPPSRSSTCITLNPAKCQLSQWSVQLYRNADEYTWYSSTLWRSTCTSLECHLWSTGCAIDTGSGIELCFSVLAMCTKVSHR